MRCRRRMWSAQDLAEARPDILVMSSGNQKFALVAPHMERRRNADWVSLTQGMRWKSTCYCLVLCARNSCTNSCFHPRPSPLVGQLEANEHLDKQQLRSHWVRRHLYSTLGSCRGARGCGRVWPFVRPPSCAMLQMAQQAV